VSLILTHLKKITMKKMKMIMLLALIIGIAACNPCEKSQIVPCGASNNNPKVDLIVLIDASGSMGQVADSISAAANIAIMNAVDMCKSDLKVTYLGVDGVWPGTVFNTQHRNFIFANYGIVPLAADMNHVGWLPEQGANAIQDLSKYGAWRDSACRCIFYISDEELDSFNPIGDVTNEDQVTQDAILAAKANGVAVFTNYITAQLRGPTILQNYVDLTTQTGGINFTTSSYSEVTTNLYIGLMPTIVCNGCNGCNLNGLIPQ